MGDLPHQPLSHASAAASAPAPAGAAAVASAGLALAIALIATVGCGLARHTAAPAPSITLSVTSPTTCNHGRPLQAIVRAVTLKQFVEDQYRTIAQLVVSPDESVLTSFVVFPGVAQTIKLTPPAKGTAAVYFLFTDATGTSWKQQLDASATTARLQLADDQISQPGAAPPAGAR